MPDPTTASAPPRRPESVLDLFITFTVMAMQGFGGVLAIVQNELVERKKWMTRDEFVEEWAVAQIMPGPNVVNMALIIGARYYGLRGAMAALAGMLTMPLILLVLLALLHAHYASHPGVAGALRGMSAVAAGLLAATGLKLASTLHKHPLRLPFSAALALMCFIAIALLRLPLAVVLPVLGLIACVLTYLRLKQ